MIFSSIASIGVSQICLAGASLTGTETLQSLGALLQQSIADDQIGALQEALHPHVSSIQTIQQASLFSEDIKGAMERLLDVIRGDDSLTLAEAGEISGMISGALTFLGVPTETHLPTQLMEEQVAARLRYETVLAECGHRLLSATGESDPIRTVLALLRGTSEADSVSIFENSTDPVEGLVAGQINEVLRTDVTPTIHRSQLRNIPYARGYSHWVSTLSDGKPMIVSVADFAESERTVLESQGLQSILLIPITVNNKWFGMIAITHMDEQHQWLDEDIKMLSLAGEMIGAYLERIEAQKTMVDMAADMARMRVLGILSHAFRNHLVGSSGHQENLQHGLAFYRHLLEVCAACNAISLTEMTPIIDLATAGFDEIVSRQAVAGTDFETLNRMSNDMISFSRIGSGEKVFLSVKSKMVEISEVLQKMAEAENVRLSFDLEGIDYRDGLIIADGDFFEIVKHLVVNSVEAYRDLSQEGERDVTVRLFKKEGHILMEVIDHAAGIAPEKIEEVFKSEIYSYKPGQMGLGLLAVKRATEAADGKVSIDSRIGKGTKVTVAFPLIKAAKHVSAVREEPFKPQISVEEAATLTVMMIDDNAAVLQVGRGSLERLGFNVITFTDPHVAVEAYEGMEEKPQIVLVDQTMPLSPNMQGHNVIERLTSKEEAVSGSRFAIYSGNVMSEAGGPIATVEQRLRDRDIPLDLIQKGYDPDRFRYDVTRIGYEILRSIPAGELQRKIRKAKGTPFERSPLSSFMGRVVHKINNLLMIGTYVDFIKGTMRGQESFQLESSVMELYQEFERVVEGLESYALGKGSLPKELDEDVGTQEAIRELDASEQYKLALIARLYLDRGLRAFIEKMERIFSFKDSFTLYDLQAIQDACEELARLNNAIILSNEFPEEAVRFKNYYEILAKMPPLPVSS